MAPLPSEDAYDFCSVYAQDMDEPLLATATRADVWLLLEYTGAWEARAFPASDLSAEVKEQVDDFGEMVPNTRLQFIRKPGPYEVAPIHFYMAVAHDDAPRLYAFELERYDDLLDLNLEEMVAGDEAYDAYLSDEKLFLVCVNGRRDACCARFGIPVHAAVADAAGEQAWQSTHIGGHRLAPNLLFLPHGLSYGRGTPETAEALVNSYRRGEVSLPHLRGRTIYDRPVQAALHFLRERTGVMGVDAYRPVTVEERGEEQWQVAVEGREDGAHYVVNVVARPLPQPVYKTCQAETPSMVEHYYLAGDEDA